MKRLLTKSLKVFAWIIGSILLLLIAAILLLRLPSVQTYITGKVAHYISSRTHTRVEVHSVFIDFPKSLVIEDIFLEDLHHDTLISIGRISADIGLFGFLSHKIKATDLYIKDLTTHIDRGKDSVYNFDFLANAFKSGNEVKKENEKDTVKSSWDFQIGRLELENCNGSFIDAPGGMEFHGGIGRLDLKMKNLNLTSMEFNAQSLLVSGATIRLRETALAPDTIVTDTGILPSVALKKLELDNIQFDFSDSVSGSSYNAFVGKLYAEPDKIDLNKHVLKIVKVSLADSHADITMLKDSTKKTEANDTTPGWEVSAGRIEIAKTDLKYNISNIPAKNGSFDENHLGITGFSTSIRDIYFAGSTIKAFVESTSLREQSGIELKTFSGDIDVSDARTALKNLVVETGGSRIRSDIELTYKSFEDISAHPGETGLAMDLRTVEISMPEASVFAPVIKTEPSMRGIKNKLVRLKAKLRGKVKDLYADEFKLWASSTSIDISGKIKGLPDAKNSYYGLNIHSIQTVRSDVLSFIPTDSLPVEIPEYISMKGDFNGSMNDFKTKLTMGSSAGSLNANAQVKMTGDTIYQASIQATEIDLGYLLRNKKLGKLTGNADANGRHASMPLIDAKLNAALEHFYLNGYDYHDIKVNGTAYHESYEAKASVHDSALLATINGIYSNAKDHELVKFDLDLKGADLHAMQVTDEKVRTSGKMQVNLTGSKPEDLNGRVTMSEVVILKNQSRYKIDSLMVVSVNDKRHSALRLKSGFINGEYEGTLAIVKLSEALSHHIDHYFALNNKADTLPDNSNESFKLSLQVSQNPILTDILFPGLSDFSGLNINAAFDESKEELQINATTEGFTYKGNNLQAFNAAIKSDAKALQYSVSFNSFKAGAINLSKTILNGSLKQNILDFTFRITDKDSGDKIAVAGNVHSSDHRFILHLDNDKLVLNNQKWIVNAENYIRTGGPAGLVMEMELSNGSQSVKMHTDTNAANTPIKIHFDHFETGTLSKLVEKDTAILRGDLNGDLEFRKTETSRAFKAEMKITNIVYMLHPVGNLELQANDLDADKYVARILLTGNENNIEMSGSYLSSGKQPIDFRIDIRQLNMKTVEGFSINQIRYSQGSITGKLNLSGNANAPQINGELNFVNAGFNLKYFNNYILLKNEKLRIDPEGIYFQSFTITDTTGHTADISGNILTKDFQKMKFGLKVRTNNFTIANTTINDNPLYFGHIIVSSSIDIRGTESLPVVTANARLIGGSTVTVLIPSAELSTDRGEGIVTMRVHPTGNTIMDKVDSSSVPGALKGFDLSANIEVSKDATLMVLVDRNSGDLLLVKGEGRLSFSMDPGGNQSLTGTYQITEGSYNASFQSVVKRKFIIKPGGSITWNGNLMDAALDLDAIYTLRTSSLDLLSTELSGSSAAERNTYRRLLTFDVNMMIKGALKKPEIGFMIDMADKDKAAFGGMVYSKVNALNTDPTELNKQVFALLVLNKFMPEGPSDASGNAVSTVAINSVNQILTDQLNKLTGKHVKAVELSFDIHSNDMYTQTGVQQNTEVAVGVKKSFLNNRLSVQVGSSVNVDENGTPQADAGSLTGDVVVEYKLTEDGRLRVKAFRQNQYEGIIDGLLYKTGISLIYTRDYERLKDLFVKPEEDELNQDNPDLK
jgi:hypothetical protein